MPDTPGDPLAVLQIPLAVATLRRLEQEAARRGMSAPDLARAAVEQALAGAPGTPDGREGPGYQWKNVFLPDGTVLSFTHKGTPHLATVVGGELRYEGRSVSPSEFVNSVSGATRNAWRDILIKCPSDVRWMPAQELRNEATAADLARKRALAEAISAAGTEAVMPAIADMLGRRRRFGSLPISERMGPRFMAASLAVARIIETGRGSADDPTHLSEAKGMFNRVVKHDRHDWMAVQQILGMPDRKTCVQAVAWLKDLRRLVTEGAPLSEHLGHPTAAVVAESFRNAIAELEEQGFGDSIAVPLDITDGDRDG